MYIFYKFHVLINNFMFYILPWLINSNGVLDILQVRNVFHKCKIVINLDFLIFNFKMNN